MKASVPAQAAVLSLRPWLFAGQMPKLEPNLYHMHVVCIGAPFTTTLMIACIYSKFQQYHIVSTYSAWLCLTWSVQSTMSIYTQHRNAFQQTKQTTNRTTTAMSWQPPFPREAAVSAAHHHLRDSLGSGLWPYSAPVRAALDVIAPVDLQVCHKDIRHYHKAHLH